MFNCFKTSPISIGKKLTITDDKTALLIKRCSCILTDKPILWQRCALPPSYLMVSNKQGVPAAHLTTHIPWTGLDLDSPEANSRCCWRVERGEGQVTGLLPAGHSPSVPRQHQLLTWNPNSAEQSQARLSLLQGGVLSAPPPPTDWPEGLSNCSVAQKRQHCLSVACSKGSNQRTFF